MNKRRRFKAKRRRSWARAFAQIDATFQGGCSRGARHRAIKYLRDSRPGGTTRSWE